MSLIKVFLGGYINFTNAQNLNCRSLAQHLDKDAFEVYTLELYNGQGTEKKNKGMHTFRCFRPHRVSIYLGYLWGIWHCDVAYLPKGEIWRFNRFLIWLFRKKSFTTMEGIWDEKNLISAIELHSSYENLVKSYQYFDKVFAITDYVGRYNSSKHGIICSDKILYLGTETDHFLIPKQPSRPLNKIIYIGRLMERKGIYDYLQIAESFPGLEFLIAGDGPEKISVQKYISDYKLSNVKMLGVLQHAQLAEVLAEVQLHILPSRSEGFPKVILETASAGVPSIVYGDYGASEWITQDANGWVINKFEEIGGLISKFLAKPEMLEQVADGAVKLAKSFDWSIRVKVWEEAIMNLVKKK